MDDVLQRPDAAAASHAQMPAPDRLLAMATAFWRSAVLLSANDLGLFATLAAGPLDACSLARRLALCPDTAVDILEALVALNLVEPCGAQYRNTPEASLFLDPAMPTYIGRWLAMASTAMCQMANITTSLRVTGANEQGCLSLVDRMWADIAEILHSSKAPDDL